METKCNLCPRQCNVDRSIHTGFCNETDKVRIARAALHFYEEPCISGLKGSGAVFFCGCNLKCVFCQNAGISLGLQNISSDIKSEISSVQQNGKEIDIPKLSDIFLSLQKEGAENINLVTPSHFVYQIKEALILSKKNGLNIPVVYNSSAYELPETLKQLEGLIDIYLPDFKYIDDSLAVKYSNAPNYSSIAKAAIDEMFRQTGECQFDTNGLIKKGVIVRHLLLPLGVKNAKGVVSYLHEKYGDSLYISLMNQYTPVDSERLKKAGEKYPELLRKVTKREYNRLIDHVLSLNIKNAYIQEGKTASESFIPAFDFTGLD